MTLVQVATKTCPGCGKASTLEVDKAGYKAWQQGTLIQRALPDLTADQREQLITGYHGKCWDVLFPDEDEEGVSE